MVYIQEAHALDGASPMRSKGAPVVEEPLTLDERKAVATTCAGALDMSPLKMLIDDMKDTVATAYAGLPDRLYLIARDGKVAYQGERGPRGFDPAELGKAIEKELGVEKEKAPKKRR